MALNQAFSACSFIAFVMSFVPFPWHMQASNTGICLYMFWVGLGNLAYFINSIIWDGNVVNWAPLHGH
jgi:pheromone a factor receptor